MLENSTENIQVSGTVTLNLAGHVLNGANQNSSVIWIKGPSGNLTVIDTDPEAWYKFFGTLPGKPEWDEDIGTGTLILGGCITGGSAGYGI